MPMASTQKGSRRGDFGRGNPYNSTDSWTSDGYSEFSGPVQVSYEQPPDIRPKKTEYVKRTSSFPDRYIQNMRGKESVVDLTASSEEIGPPEPRHTSKSQSNLPTGFGSTHNQGVRRPKADNQTNSFRPRKGDCTGDDCLQAAMHDEDLLQEPMLYMSPDIFQAITMANMRTIQEELAKCNQNLSDISERLPPATYGAAIGTSKEKGVTAKQITMTLRLSPRLLFRKSG
ncbi:uncharacterized protein LOC133801732 [Humulus lupulus]|uniref:uncharacterized protein LOC133801732 n=1 Tax=Humulus lupulus TaxID=3486 RepID=UPI002B40F114|nr:uncharacterized protein LOC133801732 [Humulus lupulus]